MKNSLKLTSGYDIDDRLKDKYEIPIDRLVIKKVLGSGIGGVVKLATLQDDQKTTRDVAVKMLRGENFLQTSVR